MSSKRPLNRRSFVTAVTGGAAAGAALALVSGMPGLGQAHERAKAAKNGWEDFTPTPVAPRRNGPRTNCNDADPRDERGYGQRCSTAPPSGCSDNDTGTDQWGHGARCRAPQPSGCSDQDPNDPGGNGRHCTARGR